MRNRLNFVMNGWDSYSFIMYEWDGLDTEVDLSLHFSLIVKITIIYPRQGLTLTN